MRVLTSLLLLLSFFAALIDAHSAEPSLRTKLNEPRRIGVIASLSGFAAGYGSAVRDGAIVAAEELRTGDSPVELKVEDDASATRNTLGAYRKLKSLDRIEALVGGSWWMNGIATAVDRDGIPLLSCETLHANDFVQAPHYFTLAGDLREWIRVYEPLIQQRGWKRAAMIKFVSGFSDTLREELQRVFSAHGRTFLGAIEYTDISMTGAQTLATQAKSLGADVLFIDAQPESFADIIRHLQALGVHNLSILTHSAAMDAFRDGLFAPKDFDGEIFFLQRAGYDQSFSERFKARFGRPPSHNADLGYLAVHIASQLSRNSATALSQLREGIVVDGTRYAFNSDNVNRGVRQEIYTFDRSAQPAPLAMEAQR